MGARSRSYLLKGLVLTRSQAVLEGCWGLPLPGWLAKARDPRAVSMYGFYLSDLCGMQRAYTGAEKGSCGNWEVTERLQRGCGIPGLFRVSGVPRAPCP